jgi:hypothetical protein
MPIGPQRLRLRGFFFTRIQLGAGVTGRMQNVSGAFNLISCAVRDDHELARVCTENSSLAMKSLFSDDAAPISSSN